MQSSSFWRQPAALAAIAVVAFVLGAPFAVLAQDGGADGGPAVARVSLIAGDVGIQRGDSADAQAAALNAPLLGGDYITTGERSRAEVEFDGTTMVRLADGVQMRITQLDPGNRSLQLAAGTVELRLLRGTDGASSIDTPSISVRPQQSGIYRVTVTPDGQTRVSVRSGRAEIDTPQGPQELTPGSTFVAQGAASNPTIQIADALPADSFDTFNADRDRLHERVADAPFNNDGMGGVEDLAGNGTWQTDPSYGQVWIPADVGPDWAPYRDGRWVWEDGYGWTWVAAEPWGWAPYHYGSWYHSPRYGWAWCPPPRGYAPPWRPALVAFFSFGGGGGLGFDLGWVPLAPFEPYHPWWGRGRHGDNTTIVNNITVNNINVYRNVRYNGVTGTSSQRFLQGNFTRNVAFRPEQLRAAHVYRGAIPVVPTSANLRYTQHAARTSVAVRPELMQRSFAGHTATVHRTPFEAQRTAIATITHAAAPAPAFGPAHRTPTSFTPNRAPTTVTPNRAPTTVTPTTVTPNRAPIGIPRNDPWARFNENRGAATRSTTNSYSTNHVNHPPAGEFAAPHTVNTYSNAAPRVYRAPSGDTTATQRQVTTQQHRYTPVNAAPARNAAPRERSAPPPQLSAPTHERSAPPPAPNKAEPAAKHAEERDVHAAHERAHQERK